MQQVAAEMNLAETAFLVPQGDGFGLRWFTPTVEVELCGHATLASAHALWQVGRVPGARIAFETPAARSPRSLTAIASRSSCRRAPMAVCTTPDGLVDALGAVPRVVSDSVPAARTAIWSSSSRTKPRCARWRRVSIGCARCDFGVIATARGTGRYDFISRYFAVPYGIDEDPVTGSAHCSLAPYWAERLGKTTFLAWQASARGGELLVTLGGDRVRLSGHAVTVLRGELTV